MPKVTKVFCATLLAMVAGFGAGAANAAVIDIYDRTTFSTAVAGGAITVEDFDSFASGVDPSTATVTYSASLGTVFVSNQYLSSTNPNGIASTSYGYFVPWETATISFSTPITAFAIDINTYANTDGAYQAVLSTGDVVGSLFDAFLGASTGQFLGFVSDTAFTSVIISSITGFSYTLDTLIYGDAADIESVPLPAALPLFAGALGVFGAAGWRKRRRGNASA